MTSPPAGSLPSHCPAPGDKPITAASDFDVVAYGGNAEDVVLLRAFADRPGGFFVDVGAGDPTFGSVTKNLVDRLGWRGINIEPLPECRARLEAERPGDVNLTIAIDEQAGTTRFYRIVAANGLVGGPALSTLDPDMVARHRAAGWGVEDLEVETEPLSDILALHAPEHIDLLKVDVEGAEARVLRSAELERWQPRVVVVEATLPHTTVQSHDDWEPLMFGAGYRLALFDGVNRFYALAHEHELLQRLAIPANVTDRYIPHHFALALGAARLRGIVPRNPS